MSMGMIQERTQGMNPSEAVSARDSAGGLDLLTAVLLIWAAELVAAIGLFVWSELSPLGVFLWAAMSTGCTLGFSWYFLCRKYGRSFVDGFALFPVDGKTLMASALMGLAGAMVGSTFVTHEGPQNHFMAHLTSTQAGIAVVVFLGLALPPFEELYYRGFIFSALRKELGSMASVVLVTLWFSIAHCAQLTGHWWGILLILTMGGIYALQRHLTNSLVPSIVTHWTYNSAMVLTSVLSLRN